MTADDFRRIALGLPQAVEQSHMGHADFRVGGKIFATLGYPDAASISCCSGCSLTMAQAASG